jgi:hypothetical protein
MTRHPAANRTKDIHWHGLMLCVGLLGAVAALVLRPAPLVVGISLGVLLCCLLVVVFRALRRAGHRIDRIVAEELESDVDGNPAAPPHEPLRKTA